MSPRARGDAFEGRPRSRRASTSDLRALAQLLVRSPSTQSFRAHQRPVDVAALEAAHAESARPQGSVPAWAACARRGKLLVDPVVTPEGQTWSRNAALARWPASELYPDIQARDDVAAFITAQRDGQAVLPPEPADCISLSTPLYPVVTKEGHLYDLGGLAQARTRSKNSPMTGAQMDPKVRLCLRATAVVNPELVQRVAAGQEPIEFDLDALADQIRAIRKDGKLLDQAPRVLQLEPFTVGSALETFPGALDGKPPALRGNADIIGRGVEVSTRAYRAATRKVRRQRTIQETLVRAHGTGLRMIPRGFLKAGVERTAIQAHGEAIIYADPAARTDRVLGGLAVKTNGWALGALAAELQADPEIRADAARSIAHVTKAGMAELECLSKQIEGHAQLGARGKALAYRKEKSALLMRAARGEALDVDERQELSLLERAGKALAQHDAAEQFFCKVFPAMLKEPQVMLAACEVHPPIWSLLSYKMRGRPEFLPAAVKARGPYVLYDHGFSKKDTALVRKLLETDGRVLELLPKKMRDDPELVRLAIEQNPLALQYASKRLRGDHDIVYAAVERNGLALQHALPPARGAEDICVRAVQQNGRALEHVPYAQQKNPKVVRAAVQRYGRALKWAFTLRDDPEIVGLAIDKDPMALEFAGPKSQKRPELVMSAAIKNPRAFEHAHSSLRDDREFVGLLLEDQPRAIEWASREVQAHHAPALVARVPDTVFLLQPALRDDPKFGVLYFQAKPKFQKGNATMRRWLRAEGQGGDVLRALLENPELDAATLADLKAIREVQALIAADPALAVLWQQASDRMA